MDVCTFPTHMSFWEEITEVPAGCYHAAGESYTD